VLDGFGTVIYAERQLANLLQSSSEAQTSGTVPQWYPVKDGPDVEWRRNGWRL